MAQRTALNALIGFLVGIAGGLIGLGGAELRLPWLVGSVRMTVHEAVPVNLAISLLTILAAVPSRLLVLPYVSLAPFLIETVAIALGAIIAAWVGAGWLKRLSGAALGRLIFVLLIVLGVTMVAEARIELASTGLLPQSPTIRFAAGLLFGLLIGAISSVLGVAGGEVIIPTLVFGYGAAIKTAGSLSMMISLPTVVVGLMHHARAGAFSDRSVLAGVVVPMGIGSALGAITGGTLSAYVAGGLIKAALGLLLIWSAWKVFAKHG